MIVNPASVYEAAKMVQVLSKLISDAANGDIGEEEFRAQMRNISDRCRGANDAWDAVDDDAPLT